MVMVYVPGGEFEMGGTLTPHEQPIHHVTVDSFWIDQTEVTNAQYSLCIEAGACEEPEFGAWESGLSASMHPVVGVNWEQASDYAEWVGGRLPTEAEWEFAARGPDSGVFPWGDEFDGTLLNYCDVNCTVESVKDERFDDGYILTAPVGMYSGGASWCGTLDQAGNAQEWVADWYSVYTTEPQVNPAGPETGDIHVVRGGSWENHWRHARSNYRINIHTAGYGHRIGFRVALDQPPE
jgi:formylglycine-generating enzyme required for sulfatase activity